MSKPIHLSTKQIDYRSRPHMTAIRISVAGEDGAAFDTEYEADQAERLIQNAAGLLSALKDRVKDCPCNECLTCAMDKKLIAKTEGRS